jgi:hypothetical protein
MLASLWAGPVPAQQAQQAIPIGFGPDRGQASREALRLQILSDERAAEETRLAAARLRVGQRTAAGDRQGVQDALAAIPLHEAALASLAREIATVTAAARHARPSASPTAPAEAGPAVIAQRPSAQTSPPAWWDVYGRSSNPAPAAIDPSPPAPAQPAVLPPTRLQ